MTFEGYFTIAVVVAMTAGLALDIVNSALILFSALVVCLLSGVITAEEAVAGFSNEGMITVGALFIVSQAVHHTGGLNAVLSTFLGARRKGSLSFLLFKVMAPVSFLSAFLNNTPIVVIFTPLIRKWAERINISVSKFLIPLSYAAIFGGACTLVGTSTNLVVHGLMLERGIEGIAMFELAKVGIPCAVLGCLYLSLAGHRLLPERKSITQAVGEHRKEYAVEVRIDKKCQFVGKTIEEAGLRNFPGLFLMDIQRNGRSLGPVAATERIYAGDLLLFVGLTSAVVRLYEIPGVLSVAEEVFEKGFEQERRSMLETVISPSSPVVGKTVKECRFRSKYGAGVVAVHRNGERVKSRIGDIRLRAGDTLLLLAKPQFVTRWADSQDFYLISTLKQIPPKADHKAVIALGIVLAMVFSVAFAGHLPKLAGKPITMLHAAFAAVLLLFATKCIRLTEAKTAISWDVLVTIACAFGITKALSNSGAADGIASSVIGTLKVLGPTGVLAAVYFITMVFTAIITNCAAAALMFPVAYSAAGQLEVDPRAFFITIAIAASASFVTPIGYQTNLIVQGAGGYKFRDYLKVGLPLNLLFFAASVLLIPWLWGFGS